MAQHSTTSNHRTSAFTTFRINHLAIIGNSAIIKNVKKTDGGAARFSCRRAARTLLPVPGTGAAPTFENFDYISVNLPFSMPARVKHNDFIASNTTK
jgi:hypothetical protein